MNINAYAAIKAKGKLEPFTYPARPLEPFEILVDVTHCGICHTDLHLIDNDWGNSVYPLVPGHEIVGNVSKKGSLVQGIEIGDRIGISWQRSSCLHCEYCLKGEENVCLEKTATCHGNYGGFADKMIADGRFAYHIPKEIDSLHAAPLLCGGAAVFGPLKRHRVAGDMSVAVVGIGGLGHLALQFAKALGCKVSAISTSKDKEQEAKNFGAHDFYTLDDLQKKSNLFDYILYTAPMDVELNFFLTLVRPNGILCFLPKLKKELKLLTTYLVSGQKTVCGNTVPARAVIQEMLDFCAKHKIQPTIESFPMKEVNVAIDKLRKEKPRYRIVLYN